jgi:hypothetical protein
VKRTFLMSSHRCAAQPFLATLASTIPVAVLTATILTVGALRLPLDVLPGAAYVALLGLPVLARHGDSPRANPDFQFGVYGGTAYTMKSRLHLSQPGGTDLSFHDVSWVGEPFRTPPYYGLRAIYWLPASAYGLMGDFTHIKARAERGLAVKQSGTRDGMAVPVEEPLSHHHRRWRRQKEGHRGPHCPDQAADRGHDLRL